MLIYPAKKSLKQKTPSRRGTSSGFVLVFHRKTYISDLSHWDLKFRH